MPLCSKVNSVKMVIELQFNYISMMIPVNIPDTTFKRCNKIINDFLWAGKRPQIKMSKLCSPRDGIIFLLKRPSWLNTGETDSGWTGLKQNRNWHHHFIPLVFSHNALERNGTQIQWRYIQDMYGAKFINCVGHHIIDNHMHHCGTTWESVGKAVGFWKQWHWL